MYLLYNGSTGYLLRIITYYLLSKRVDVLFAGDFLVSVGCA